MVLKICDNTPRQLTRVFSAHPYLCSILGLCLCSTLNVVAQICALCSTRFFVNKRAVSTELNLVSCAQLHRENYCLCASRGLQTTLLLLLLFMNAMTHCAMYCDTTSNRVESSHISSNRIIASNRVILVVLRNKELVSDTKHDCQNCDVVQKNTKKSLWRAG